MAADQSQPETEQPHTKPAWRNDQTQAEQVLDWLRQFGFTYNPFQERNSERDINLSEHFIEPPDFDTLLEVNNQAIFARMGDGKTAMRLRLQSFYRDAFADRRLCFFLSDFAGIGRRSIHYASPTSRCYPDGCCASSLYLAGITGSQFIDLTG
ncbi:MAG: hypothetical protein R3E79_33200 [Caldilineaceae bacterium]